MHLRSSASKVVASFVSIYNGTYTFWLIVQSVGDGTIALPKPKLRTVSKPVDCLVWNRLWMKVLLVSKSKSYLGGQGHSLIL